LITSSILEKEITFNFFGEIEIFAFEETMRALNPSFSA